MAERLLHAVGRPELIMDPRFATNAARLEHAETLDAIIADFIAKMTQADCVAFFARTSLTVGPVYDVADINEDAHFHEREIVVELPDVECGAIPVHNISPRLLETPGGFHRPAPALGEHTAEVLKDLGYGDAAIAALTASGVVKIAQTAATRSTMESAD
jgi:crotonobetainyl-CoA:carnitine CoA-transferase CaiB-like acyl-CoA transferase